MEAAWASAVDRAAGMADSAKRFFLSFRCPHHQQQQPPPPPPPHHPSPNPVSESTTFSSFVYAVQIDVVEVGHCPVFALAGMRMPAG
jgi:hypothetical protein